MRDRLVKGGGTEVVSSGRGSRRPTKKVMAARAAAGIEELNSLITQKIDNAKRKLNSPGVKLDTAESAALIAIRYNMPEEGIRELVLIVLLGNLAKDMTP